MKNQQRLYFRSYKFSGMGSLFSTQKLSGTKKHGDTVLFQSSYVGDRKVEPLAYTVYLIRQ